MAIKIINALSLENFRDVPTKGLHQPECVDGQVLDDITIVSLGHAGWDEMIAYNVAEDNKDYCGRTCIGFFVRRGQ
jgi:hypothetical protein